MPGLLLSEKRRHWKKARPSEGKGARGRCPRDGASLLCSRTGEEAPGEARQGASRRVLEGEVREVTDTQRRRSRTASAPGGTGGPTTRLQVEGEYDLMRALEG